MRIAELKQPFIERLSGRYVVVHHLLFENNIEALPQCSDCGRDAIYLVQETCNPVGKSEYFKPAWFYCGMCEVG